MSHNFKSYASEQDYILPPSILDWLPEDELAWFVMDAVKVMDIRNLYHRYRQDGSGGSAYNPQMMLSLLLYSYCVGERSSRKIERLCKMDMAYRVITANQYPDHATIARFRRDNLSAADNGYLSEANLQAEDALQVELIISTKQDAKQRKEFATTVVEKQPSESQTKTERMREKLKGE